MRSNLLFGLLMLTQLLAAQTFTEMPQSPPFDGVHFSSTAFCDVDGDGDQDVLIAGINNQLTRVSKLYLNDGAGNFTEKPGTPFPGVMNGSVDFSDVDMDGDFDVLITGEISMVARTSKLYINDGTGNFTEKTGAPFNPVKFSSAAFSDVDSDGDNDVLITGLANNFQGLISKLYINDGEGNYVEKPGTPFVGVRIGSVAFSDVDGDGDQDVLITGLKHLQEQFSKLYTNDGDGNFTEKSGIPFDDVSASSVAFSDVDGDGDDDVLIAGANSSAAYISKLYLNDGGGNFTEKTNTPFEGVVFGSVPFSDVDLDGDYDVLITGENSSGNLISKLYINGGGGNFTEMAGTPFEGVRYGSVALSDVDGDGDDDVLITGRNNSGEGISKLYINNGDVSSTDDLPLRFNLVFTPYPNPTVANTLNVEYYSAENSFVNISLYDLQGHLLSQQKEFAVLGKQTFSVDIAPLRSGSYFIQLDDGKGKGVAKFVVK